MPTGVLVPERESDVKGFADRAESLGYDSVWVSELWGTDAFVALTRAAMATDEIRLGTAIINVYGRSPATIAQAAASLDRASDGRAVLGLGTSTKKTIEDLHSHSFENPPRRLHETAELTKEFLHGEDRVHYEGKVFDVADFPSLDADVPVYTAALGPANRRATGRTADGWLPHNIPFEHLGEAFETIAETAEAAGRDPGSITTAPYVPAAVSEDPAEAQAAARGHLAYYLGSGEGYRKAASRAFPDEADAVADAWRSGDRDAARDAVTEEMIDGLAIAGTPEDARAQYEDLVAIDAVDEPIIVVPAGASEDLQEQTVTALSPSRR